ncbi:MAG: hypothetical protein ACQ9ET_00130 [Nitrosomonadaceae bacterium]
MNVTIKLRDQFSGCIDTRTATIPKEKFQELNSIMIDKKVVSQFDKKAAIRYHWTIEEIKIN